MIDFTFKRSFFLLRELMFLDRETVNKGEDVLIYHSNNHVCEYVNKCIFASSKSQLTVVNALTENEDVIWSNINKNYRYEIRRAEREGISTTIYCSNEITDALLNAFEQTYNHMFDVKKLSLTFNRKMAEAARHSGNLFISVSYDSDNKPLIYHEYFADEKNAILIYSASCLWDEDDSEKKKIVGYANKRLHWDDMMYFKTTGRETFEWGGIGSTDDSDGIGKFKREFGGEVKEYTNSIMAKSIKGIAYICLLKLRNK